MSLAHRLPFGLRHLLPLTSQYREVRAQQHQIVEGLSKLRQTLSPEVMHEIALPSYTHQNPLMRHLFWERLAVALEWLDNLAPVPSVVMDFGCGLGVLFPALTRRGLHVLAWDIHPEAPAGGAQFFGIKEIEILDARERFEGLSDGSVDAILALDVLEHVNDVASLAAEFRRLLGANGRLLCSLPTENAFYRLGRRLAGFSGAYHVHGPQHVVRGLSSCLKTRRIARLYSFLPLFDFFEAHT